MSSIAVTWRECPRQKIKAHRGYQPPEPYETDIDTDFPNLLTGEEVAEMIIEAQVENCPDDWSSFDYVIEIIAPGNLAGRYAVEVNMEPECQAWKLNDEDEVKAA